MLVAAQALQRRESLRQADGDQLVDAFRLDVLQPVKTQVPDRHVGQQPGRRQQPRHVRQHYLAAMRGHRDPGRPVHVHPHVAILMPGRLSGVQAHPDPDGHAFRPGMGGKSALRRHTARNRGAGGLEHHEKAVALGSHLAAAVLSEAGAQQGALDRQRLAIPVAKAAQQCRRSLDVAEQQRERPSREFRHAPDYHRTAPRSLVHHRDFGGARPAHISRGRKPHGR
jgi:hypothetical protein